MTSITAKSNKILFWWFPVCFYIGAVPIQGLSIIETLTWVLTELRIFPEPAPRNVAPNEDGADDAPYDAEQQEGK